MRDPKSDDNLDAKPENNSEPAALTNQSRPANFGEVELDSVGNDIDLL